MSQSTHEGTNKAAPYGGVDTSSKPHLITVESWLTGTNIRFYNGATQQPRKKVMCNTRNDSSDAIVQLAAIPKRRGRALVVAMSQKQIWQVSGVTGGNAGVEIPRARNLVRATTDSQYRRWGTKMYK